MKKITIAICLFSFGLLNSQTFEIGKDDNTITLDQKITGLYIAFFKRAADKEGLEFWKNRGETVIADGKNISNTLEELADGFAKHQAFAEIYSNFDNKTFVEKIYRNTLGQDGDIEGIKNWTTHLDNGMSRSDMVSEFIKASLSLDLTSANFPTFSSEE